MVEVQPDARVKMTATAAADFAIAITEILWRG
jgi:hypothetical protein